MDGLIYNFENIRIREKNLGISLIYNAVSILEELTFSLSNERYPSYLVGPYIVWPWPSNFLSIKITGPTI
jgi:hypothetical protein